jgi:hypothetical protein
MSAVRLRWALLLGAALLALAVAGCGGSGGGATTVTETVTNTVAEEAPAEGTTAAGETTSEEATGESEPTAGAGAGIAEPATTRYLTSFRSPSGNIGCILFKGDARCDIRKREWKPPPRPASCPHVVDFGQGLQVGATGKSRFVCAGDTTLNESAPRLAYGTGAKVDGTLCVSQTAGVTCVNEEGSGFFISVQRAETF